MAGIVQEPDHVTDHSQSHIHHVKFNLQEEEVRSHHENLEITNSNETTFDINLGYLKVNHYYRVAFTLDLGSKSEINDGLISKYSLDKSSKNISFKEIKESANGTYTFLIVFFASKEKLDKESIYFIANDHDQSKSGSHHTLLTINFEAKVLGAHQGTPLLRNGITLLAQHQSSEKTHFNIN